MNLERKVSGYPEILSADGVPQVFLNDSQKQIINRLRESIQGDTIPGQIMILVTAPENINQFVGYKQLEEALSYTGMLPQSIRVDTQVNISRTRKCYFGKGPSPWQDFELMSANNRGVVLVPKHNHSYFQLSALRVSAADELPVFREIPQWREPYTALNQRFTREPGSNRLKQIFPPKLEGRLRALLVAKNTELGYATLFWTDASRIPRLAREAGVELALRNYWGSGEIKKTSEYELVKMAMLNR